MVESRSVEDIGDVAAWLCEKAFTEWLVANEADVPVAAAIVAKLGLGERVGRDGVGGRLGEGGGVEVAVGGAFVGRQDGAGDTIAATAGESEVIEEGIVSAGDADGRAGLECGDAGDLPVAADGGEDTFSDELISLL